MHQQIDKKKKIYLYLLIFFLLSTFNNIKLISSNFLKFNINQIRVSGLSENNNFYISEEIKTLLLENIFLVKKEFFLQILKKNNLIKSFEIKKIYPDTIEIKIKKADFLGITNIDGSFYFIGSNGKLIYTNTFDKKIPYVFGKVDIDEYIEFVKAINESRFDLNTISEIYFFPSGRWDIKTKDKKLLKLPIDNFETKLNLIYELYQSEKFKNVETIDFRFQNKIITTYE